MESGGAPWAGVRNQIRHCGWLAKRGPISSYGWQRLWCVLKGSVLVFYEDDTFRIKKGDLHIGPRTEPLPFVGARGRLEALGARATPARPPAAAELADRACGFAIAPAGHAAGQRRRLLYLDAFTAGELRDWLEAIERCAADHRLAAARLRRGLYARAALRPEPAATPEGSRHATAGRHDAAGLREPARASGPGAESAPEWTSPASATAGTVLVRDDASKDASPRRRPLGNSDDDREGKRSTSPSSSGTSSEPPTLEIWECVAGEEVDRVGLSVSSLPPELVVIKRIEDGSWAYEAGIEPGDFILGVNGVSIHEMTADDFKQALAMRPIKLKIGMDTRPAAGGVGEADTSLIGWVTSTASVMFG